MSTFDFQKKRGWDRPDSDKTAPPHSFEKNGGNAKGEGRRKTGKKDTCFFRPFGGMSPRIFQAKKKKTHSVNA